MHVESSVTGRLIPIRRDLLQQPVLRKIDSRKYRLTISPEQLRDMQLLIKRLGRAAGLEDRLTTYALRRGVAYTLATKTSKENRRFLMGHKTASRIYSEYASKIATVDLGALYRNQEPRSLAPMIGMLLNRRDDAPQSISDAGLAHCRQDPEFVELYTEYVRLRDALIGYHGTIAAALRTSDPNSRAFQQAFNRQANKFKSLRGSVYRKEYNEFFQKGGASSSSLPQSKQSTPSILTASESSRAGSPATDDTASPSSAFSAPLDWMLDSVSSNSTIRDIEYEEDGNVVIDPILLQMDLVPSDEQDLIDQLEAIEAANTDSAYTPDASEDASSSSRQSMQIDGVDSDTPDMRLHGISAHALELICAYNNPDPTRTHQPKENYGTSRSYVDPSFAEDLRQAMTAGMNEAKLAALLQQQFSTAYPPDRFYPGEEPLPGTYTCRFCDVDLLEIKHPANHAHSCARIDAVKSTAIEYDRLFPYTVACDFKKVRKVNGSYELYDCGLTFTDRRGFGDHVRTHITGNNMSVRDDSGTHQLTCFHGTCALLPDNGRQRSASIIFSSREERLVHLREQHRLVPTVSLDPTFCEFCYVWVLPFEVSEHARRHLEEAANHIANIGYTGVVGSGRQLVPRFCVFCYHNVDLDPCDRLNTFCAATTG